MKTYLILIISIEFVISIQFNEPCRFSSDACDWNLGRRWHIITLKNDEKCLIADAESKEDKRVGFTDAIMSSWLQSSSLCSFDIRFSMKFSIENMNDSIEIYLIEKMQSNTRLLDQWQMKENRTRSLDEPLWQHRNITFKTTNEFRIDIQIRHLPDSNNQTQVWFLFDDILIENCPTGKQTNTSSSTTTTSFNITNLPDEQPPINIRENLLTLIFYLLCSFIALTLLIILFSIILFTYHRDCFPIRRTTKQQTHSMGKNRIGIQIENENSPQAFEIDK